MLRVEGGLPYSALLLAGYFYFLRIMLQFDNSYARDLEGLYVPWKAA